jgi:putative oxidoreductase
VLSAAASGTLTGPSGAQEVSGAPVQWALTAMRVAVGLAYFSHGAQKLFGWFGGFGQGGAAELLSRFGAAGAIEVVLGSAIVLGLFTRVAAFLASGEMAVTYFWMHAASSGSLFWWGNRGELPFLYAFVWLFLAAFGPGRFSVDAGIESARARR